MLHVMPKPFVRFQPLFPRPERFTSIQINVSVAVHAGQPAWPLAWTSSYKEKGVHWLKGAPWPEEAACAENGVQENEEY